MFHAPWKCSGSPCPPPFRFYDLCVGDYDCIIHSHTIVLNFGWTSRWLGLARLLYLEQLSRVILISQAHRGGRLCTVVLHPCGTSGQGVGEWLVGWRAWPEEIRWCLVGWMVGWLIPQRSCCLRTTSVTWRVTIVLRCFFRIWSFVHFKSCGHIEVETCSYPFRGDTLSHQLQDLTSQVVQDFVIKYDVSRVITSYETSINITLRVWM